MADINDFGEPLGYDDDPDSEDYQPAPVDLDAVDEAACIALNSGNEAAKATAAALVLQETHRLVAECRAARKRIARWEALETREEWTVTESSSRPPRSTDLRFTADAALSLARHGKQAWRQVITTTPTTAQPWEAIEVQGPL